MKTFNLSARLFLFLAILFVVSCEPDPEQTPDPYPLAIDFIGTWDRDSMIVYEADGGGAPVIVDESAKDGYYKFNADGKGILHLNATGDFAITWSYQQSSGTIIISEPDWLSQKYSMSATQVNQVRLRGKRVSGSLSEERFLKLTKR